jgi:hypothetical protein
MRTRAPGTWARLPGPGFTLPVLRVCVIGHPQSDHTGIDEVRTAILLTILVYKLYMENPTIYVQGQKMAVQHDGASPSLQQARGAPRRRGERGAREGGAAGHTGRALQRRRSGMSVLCWLARVSSPVMLRVSMLTCPAVALGGASVRGFRVINNTHHIMVRVKYSEFRCIEIVI